MCWPRAAAAIRSHAQRRRCGQTFPNQALKPTGAADSLESAVELAKGCPVLEIGGAVDVYEAIAM
jgi:hypothetical protein